MKKILSSFIAAFCLFAAPLSALEWGGLVNNESRYTKANGNAFNQSNSVYLWMNTPVTSDAVWTFSTEGMYKFMFDAPAKVVTNVLDVDLLKLSGSVNAGIGTAQIAAGRFFVADNTGVNFAQSCDGLSINMMMSKLNVGLYAGYTGLLNNLNVSILGGEPGSTNKVYALCHGFIPLLVNAEFNNILGNNSIAVQGEAFLDTAKENKLNRTYANVTVGGPIIGTIYYSAVTSFGFVSKQIMNYSSFSVSSYPSDTIAATVGLEYASGSAGKVAAYQTVTSKTAYGAASSPEMSGCIVPSIDAIASMGSLFTEITVKAPLAMPEKSAKFAGIGADVTCVYNIFSDLQSELDVNFYKDVLNKGVDDKVSATLKFVLSF